MYGNTNNIDFKIINDYKEKGLIIINKHPSLNIFIINYTEKVQYDGLWDSFLLQARGLVVDEEGNIVARPFKKFFNIEENKYTPTSKFDVYEKMDYDKFISTFSNEYSSTSE